MFGDLQAFGNKKKKKTKVLDLASGTADRLHTIREPNKSARKKEKKKTLGLKKINFI